MYLEALAGLPSLNVRLKWLCVFRIVCHAGLAITAQMTRS